VKLAILIGIVAFFLYAFIAGIDFYLSRSLFVALSHPFELFGSFSSIEKIMLSLFIVLLVLKITAGLLMQKGIVKKNYY